MLVPTTPVLKTPPPHERSAEQFIDAGLRAPVLQRPSVIAVYSGVMFACAAAIAVIPSSAPRALAFVFVLLGVAQPFVVRRFQAEHIVTGQHVIELAVMCAIALISPSLWPLMAAWLGAALAWVAISTPLRINIPVAVVSVAAAGAVGWRTDATGWHFTVVGLALIMAAFVVLGCTVRREIWDAHASLVHTLTTAGGLVFDADLDAGVITSISGDTVGLTGWTAEHWMTTSPQELIHPDDLPNYWLESTRLEPGTIVDRIARYRRADGSWMWFRDIARVNGGPGGGRFMRGFMLDVTAMVETHELVAAQARRDDLTGLGNRLALIEHVESLIRRQQPFALLITDLDRFKEVNDTLGHEAGDALLRVMADRLAAIVPVTGLLARLGGDEFAIVLEGVTEPEQIEPFLLRLASTTSRPMVVGGVRLAVTASTGAAFSVRGGTDRPAMMRHADIAMYAAKQDTSSYCIFDESLEQTSTMQLSLAAALPRALRTGEILLHFQPKIDMRTGAIVGAEGLVRWEHPEYGLLTPNVFLDLLLMSEQAAEFARRTIMMAAEAITALRADGHEVPVAANLTVGAIRDIDFGDDVIDLLGQYAIDPAMLTIELTESDVLLPGSDQPPSVAQLAAAGVTMSIDDFGTGHSSLDRLRVLDVGELKIDRSYVNGMMSSTVDRQIVETIIGLAHRMGCRVVAEGVETEEQATALVELGCSTAQGYLFAKPMPLADLLVMASVRDAAVSVA